MTGSEGELTRDKIERDSLSKAISDVETAMAVSTPGTRAILEVFIFNARGRIAVLEKQISDVTSEREAQERQSTAALSMAQREAALSYGERETFSHFLEKEFFTRNDFGKLEQFYSKSWDRLSDEGKEEMSHRVWEGIRHDEYRFSDLPSTVKEKEAKLAYEKLSVPAVSTSRLAEIPETDRNDFVHAYQAGKREDAYHVLDRDSFRRNMALDSAKSNEHRVAGADKGADGHLVVAKIMRDAGTASEGREGQAQPDASSMADALNMDALKDVKLISSASTPSSASIPDASGARVNAR